MARKTTKILLAVGAAIAAGFAYVTITHPRLLTTDELERMAPGARLHLEDMPPPHGLTVGMPLLLAVKTFGGFGLLHAVVTVADPGAAIGYATAKTAKGHTYKISTVDERAAYLDPNADADGSLTAWANQNHAKQLGYYDAV
jgi:hypothetical protein